MARDVELSEDTTDDLGFLTIVAEEIARIRERQDYSSNSDAFVHWAVKQISPTLSESGVLSATAPKGPGEKGIDAAWFDANARDPVSRIKGIYYVVQGKCPASLGRIKKYGVGPARELHRAYNWLHSPGRKSKRSQVRAVKNEFQRKVIEQGYPCRFAVLIWGLATDDLMDSVKETRKAIERQNGGNMSFEVYDMNRLYGLYIARLEEGDIEIPDLIDFRISTDYYIKRGEIAEALVAEVPLIELYHLFEKHSLGLFAKNLRVPIVSSKYNKGIEITLDNDEERPQFWFYNNGLTAVCDDFSIEAVPADPPTMTTVSAKGMQIVNGCQTCFSIHRFASNWVEGEIPLDPLEGPTVLLRLIKTGEAKEEDSRFPHNIARYTNSQTPITPRDLHSNDPEQMRLKKAFQKDWAYFLEVKKGEWDRRLELNREIKHNYDAPFFFTNEKCGQAFVAFWNNEPASAKAKKRQMFEDENRYQSIFGFGVPPEALLLPMLLWDISGKWRVKRGFKLRGKSGKRRSGRFVTKQEVLRNGDLYLLSIIGSSMKSGWKAKGFRDVQHGILKACCRNAKELWSTYSRPTRGRWLQTVREFDRSFDTGLTLLYRHVRERVAEDEELTVRNFLIRPTTWGEFEKISSKELRKVAQQLRLRLEST